MDLCSVSLQIMTAFKVLWNEFCDTLKFSTVKLCKAKRLSPITGTYISPCHKYTSDVYCTRHRSEMASACAAYHLTRNLSSDDPLLHIQAQKELFARHEYCQRFGISEDYAHMKWCEHLKSIIERRKISDSIHKERLQKRFDRVKYGSVRSEEIDKCCISLDTTVKYQFECDAGNCDWEEIVSCGAMTDKYKKNLFLLNNYYRQSKLKDVQYLNLFENSRKKQIISVENNDDEW